jgi:hypothetical protein
MVAAAANKQIRFIYSSLCAPAPAAANAPPRPVGDSLLALDFFGGKWSADRQKHRTIHA